MLLERNDRRASKVSRPHLTNGSKTSDLTQANRFPAKNLRRMVEGSSWCHPVSAAIGSKTLLSGGVCLRSHGATRDALKYARDVFEREINSATHTTLSLSSPMKEM